MLRAANEPKVKALSLSLLSGSATSIAPVQISSQFLQILHRHSAPSIYMEATLLKPKTHFYLQGSFLPIFPVCDYGFVFFFWYLIAFLSFGELYGCILSGIQYFFRFV